MADPLTGLRRRLQLAPLLVPLLLLLAVAGGMLAMAWWAQTGVVILVPHAEAGQADNGDPDLSPAGESRALLLGAFLTGALAGGSVDHLYAANSRRSQQTAVSVANEFKLPINLLGAADWGELAGRLRGEHRGETVAVVGPAAELRSLAEGLGSTQLPLADGDHSSVFVLVSPRPAPARLLRLQYGPESGGSPAADSN